MGSSFTVTGTGFGTTTAVLLNGTAADFTITNSGSFTVTVPPGATTGPVTVTTVGGTATSASSFTVTGPPSPVVLSTSPDRNRVGARVTGPVALTFSQPIAANSAAQLRVWGNRSGGRRLDAVSGGGTATLSLQPAVAFRPGEVVQVSVPASLRGTSGVAARPEVYQFTTASGPGLGRFAAGGNVAAIPRPSSMQPADMDGDGDMDLICNVPTGLQLFLNNGRASFSPGPVNSGLTGTAEAVADVDNDGDLDLVDAGGYTRNDGGRFVRVPIPELSGEAM